MYKIVSYYYNEPEPHYNRDNTFKDYIVSQDRETGDYLIKVFNHRVNRWQPHLWICKNWGAKIYNENGDLVYQAGQFVDGWINAKPYGDEYVDQPDAL